ncbi:MAG: hypothetical protein J0I06_04885 [Planctomycetes bacterium]|nr:hypothetical protein [Planctomycetota bacterium]
MSQPQNPPAPGLTQDTPLTFAVPRADGKGFDTVNGTLHIGDGFVNLSTHDGLFVLNPDVRRSDSFTFYTVANVEPSGLADLNLHTVTHGALSPQSELVRGVRISLQMSLNPPEELPPASG